MPNPLRSDNLTKYAATDGWKDMCCQWCEDEEDAWFHGHVRVLFLYGFGLRLVAVLLFVARMHWPVFVRARRRIARACCSCCKRARRSRDTVVSLDIGEAISHAPPPPNMAGGAPSWDSIGVSFTEARTSASV